MSLSVQDMPDNESSVSDRENKSVKEVVKSCWQDALGIVEIDEEDDFLNGWAFTVSHKNSIKAQRYL